MGFPCGTAYPASFSTSHGSATCASSFEVLIPLALSNIVFLAGSILWNYFPVQKWLRRFRFWSNDKSNADEYRWAPWAGLFSVCLAVAQAAATAALIRAGGYRAAFQDLMLLWFVRPRMTWWSILLYVAAGEQYWAAGVDQFWADLVLSILGLPYLILRLEARDYVCPLGGTVGGIGILTYLVAALLYLFVLVAFLFKRELSRGWGILVILLSISEFIGSWIFWAGK